ncbi:hypothetical protein BCR42DRAFT_487520 [Absidia repens]|uniref:Uncharacterized protein n=1 Tax=Absidia repens TaxID=90262 RepID=A0A1X2IWY8_9FUNG|nr:hypothetical protein BCR42DRAFT_487520 [Absidia repens]
MNDDKHVQWKKTIHHLRVILFLQARAHTLLVVSDDISITLDYHGQIRQDGMELLSRGRGLELSCATDWTGIGTKAMKMNFQEAGIFLICICDTISSMTQPPPYVCSSENHPDLARTLLLNELVIACSLYGAYIVVYILSLYYY